MGYTLGRAAEATGKTKSAISKAIQKGRVSAVKNEDGSYSIDPAELHRVYPPVSSIQDSIPSIGAHKETENILKINQLEAKLEAAAQEKNLLYEQVSDLRTDRDEWRKQAQTLLLTAASEREQKPSISFWQRLMGRQPA